MNRRQKVVSAASFVFGVDAILNYTTQLLFIPSSGTCQLGVSFKVCSVSAVEAAGLDIDFRWKHL